MRAYLDGSQEVPEEILADYNACVLGKWMNEIGKVKYNTYMEITALDFSHQKIHQKANEIIKLKKQGNLKEAELKMDVHTIGTEIIHWIEKLEEKCSDK